MSLTPEEAERLLAVPPMSYNYFIEIEERPESWPEHSRKLDSALEALTKDEDWSLRHLAPPPNWAAEGNQAVQQWYEANPGHPGTDHERASAARQAANEVMLWSYLAPKAFTQPRIEALYASVCHWDAAVRMDLVRSIGWLSRADARATLEELVRLDIEGGWTPDLARAILTRL